MKKIYKGIISILIISMLAAGAISAVSGPYTGCVTTKVGKFVPNGIFYNFQPGTTPISTCNSGDYQISVYEKTFIDNAISNLQTQINSLTTRVSNLENNQSQTYIFGKTNDTWTNVYTWGWQKLDEFAFYSPGGNAYIEATGQANAWNVSATNLITKEMLFVDGVPDYTTIRWQTELNASVRIDPNNVVAPTLGTGFQTSKVIYLSPGNHKVELYGSGIDKQTAQFGRWSINVITK